MLLAFAASYPLDLAVNLSAPACSQLGRNGVGTQIGAVFAIGVAALVVMLIILTSLMRAANTVVNET